MPVNKLLLLIIFFKNIGTTFPPQVHYSGAQCLTGTNHILLGHTGIFRHSFVALIMFLWMFMVEFLKTFIQIFGNYSFAIGESLEECSCIGINFQRLLNF